VKTRYIAPREAPVPVGPFSPGVEIGNTLYVSGQVGIDPATGRVEAKDVKGQTTQVLKNIQAVLTAAGYTLADVVKVNVYLSDISLFDEMNEVYKTVFPSPFPARTTIASSGLLRAALVAMEAVAAKSETHFDCKEC